MYLYGLTFEIVIVVENIRISRYRNYLALLIVGYAYGLSVQFPRGGGAVGCNAVVDLRFVALGHAHRFKGDFRKGGVGRVAVAGNYRIGYTNKRFFKNYKVARTVTVYAIVGAVAQNGVQSNVACRDIAADVEIITVVLGPAVKRGGVADFTYAVINGIEVSAVDNP